MSEQKRLGILGGTFDPPHLSHLEMAKIVHGRGLVDRVLMIPCYRHAFGKTPVAFEHRLEMCRQLTKNDSYIDVLDVERKMANPGRTLELLALLERRFPDANFRLLAGGDIYEERHKWFQFHQVEKKAPPIYLSRKGVPAEGVDWLEAPAEMSSSAIRQKLSRRESVTGLLPDAVLAYIVEHQLYGV
jgi:nicotinate-nucleotide adenylyltransferase